LQLCLDLRLAHYLAGTMQTNAQKGDCGFGAKKRANYRITNRGEIWIRLKLKNYTQKEYYAEGV